jgi:DUF4097 and DUF4098 domain-containing protein YvlB
MNQHRNLVARIALFSTAFILAGCNVGPSANGSFERSFTVSGPLRLELSNASGDVQITGSTDTNVHVHADVVAHGMGFDKPQKVLDDMASNPPVELKGDTLRIGKGFSHVRNVTLSYRISVPHDTEVEISVASGAQTIQQVRGPVKVNAASGSIRVDHIDREVQLNSASGSVDADNVGDNVRAKSLSGNVNVSGAKGDVEVGALSGSIQVRKANGRIDAETADGSVDVQNAVNDVKARTASGRVTVQGNPGATSYWDLKTASGPVVLSVPSSSNFHLTAEATSGEIRADIPIVVEEQTKHALRAHVGTGGGRVEIHTVSGEIRVTGSN